jgi:cysteine desulfurase
MSNPNVYLDHSATTPVDPRVRDAMLPYLTEIFGNPSSLHRFGQRALAAVDESRRTVAEILHAQPNDIVFTANGTEADNLALRGVAFAMRAPRSQSEHRTHIITTPIEHHAILNTCAQLEKEFGFEVTRVPVNQQGMVDPDDIARAITDRTILISVMYANNEVGTIEPIAEIARVVKAHDPHIMVHTDAVQAAGSLPLDVDELGVDLLSIAAHKINGPKGVGALYVRGRTPFSAQTVGGSQERNRRAGTENVAGAVGLATALRLARDERGSRNEHVTAMRDRLLDELPRRVPDTIVTGPSDRSRRLPNSASFAFANVEGEAVLLQLDLQGIAASSGSACTTASLEPSHVLVAMGVPEAYLRGSLRLTLGHENTMEEIEYVLEVLPPAVARIRGLAPVV